MDWTKAKTILIIVFLFTNIFLGYELVKLNLSDSNYVEKSKIMEITSYLKENKFSVNTIVPNRAKLLPTIFVKYKAYAKHDLIESFFADPGKVTASTGTDEMELASGGVKIQLRDNNELYYSNENIQASSNPDETKSKAAAEAFIGKLGISDSGRLIISETVSKGYYRYMYGQMYKGVPIYNSYIELLANESGVRLGRVVWFDSVKHHSKGTNAISSIQVLLKVYQTLADKKEAVEINSMEQGYYFNVAGAQSKAVEGTAFPVWRVYTSSGILYINAYDEKLEGLESTTK